MIRRAKFERIRFSDSWKHVMGLSEKIQKKIDDRILPFGGVRVTVIIVRMSLVNNSKQKSNRIRVVCLLRIIPNNYRIAGGFVEITSKTRIAYTFSRWLPFWLQLRFFDRFVTVVGYQTVLDKFMDTSCNEIDDNILVGV